MSVCLLLLLVGLFFLFGVVSVLQHRLDVPTDEGHEEWSTETGWHEVEEGRLGVLVPVHDEDRESESGDVGDEGRVEVEVRVAVQGSVVAEQEGDEDSGDDDVAEAEHGHVLGVESVLQQVLRKDELDRSLEGLCDGDHDVGAEHPEDVVEEEASEQDAAGEHVVEVEQLNAVDSEGQAEEVVGDPVLLQEVPDADAGAGRQDDQVVSGEVVVEDLRLGRVLYAAGAFDHPQVEVAERNQVCRNVLGDERRHHVRESEDTEDEEVDREQQVDVLFGEEAEEQVQPEEGAGGDDGEHGRVLGRHRFGFLSGPRAVLSILFVRLHRPETAEEDRQEGHDQQRPVGQGHAFRRGRYFGTFGGVDDGLGDGFYGCGLSHSLLHPLNVSHDDQTSLFRLLEDRGKKKKIGP